MASLDSASTFSQEEILRGAQSTVSRRMTCSGAGLHCGREVSVALVPAPIDAGLSFRVLGDGGEVLSEFPAEISAVRSAERATVLGGISGPGVSTVEHLLAVLMTQGVDNARIDVSGEELPAFDGSASFWLDWVRGAGRTQQQASRRVATVAAPFAIEEEGGQSISIEPAPVLSIEYAIDFEHAAIGRQSLWLPEMTGDCFAQEIAGARTFGFEKEVEMLRGKGLALGGSLESAVVVGESGVLNPEGLRWPDEFVRHKVIDLLGDLALLGRPLVGRVRVVRGGHALHHGFVRALLDGAGRLVDRSPG